MMAAKESTSFRSYRQFVVIVVVVLGYGLALADNIRQGTLTLSVLETVALVATGLAFLILNLNEERLLDPRPAPWKVPLYFVVQLTLFTLSIYLAGTVNGVWLIAMPLVGTGVARLPIWAQIGSSVYILVALAWRPVVEAGWQIGFSLAMGVLPAVVFVALFVKLLMREEEARNRAEKLARDLEVANRQLSAYATQAEELAISKERNRLAREIHDSLGHYLTVINVQLQAALTVLDDDRQRAVTAVETAQQLAQDGLTSVRQSVSALRESPLGDKPLAEAIDALVQETERAGIVVETELLGRPRRLEPATELALYRTVQEGLTNIRKHSRASRVDLTLDYGDPERVGLTIKDNGVGAASIDNGGFGLVGVRERVQLLGGSVHVQTEPGQGFQLIIQIPAERPRLNSRVEST
ncbi:MAG: sensor histidine kinase [Chloroflexota bacterium]|jgi:signal transduction histidine kinase